MFTPGQISGAFEKMENGDVALTLEILARVKRGGVRKTAPGTPIPPSGWENIQRGRERTKPRLRARKK